MTNKMNSRLTSESSTCQSQQGNDILQSKQVGIEVCEIGYGYRSRDPHSMLSQPPSSGRLVSWNRL